MARLNKELSDQEPVVEALQQLTERRHEVRVLCLAGMHAVGRAGFVCCHCCTGRMRSV